MFTQNESFTLDSEEIALIKANSSADNNLVFAVLLKFIQMIGRYPTNSDFISEEMVNSLSVQLGCYPINFDNYNWTNRTAKRFRQEIRIFLNYKTPTAADKELLLQWLIKEIAPLLPTLPQCREYVSQFFQKHRLEPFSQKTINRIIRSAMHHFEKDLFATISNQLDAETLKEFSSLLQDDIDSLDEKEDDFGNNGVKLRHVKKDIAGIKLKHVNFEIEKLTRIRQVMVPTQLLGSIPRKIIQKYYTRVMASSPSNILELIPEARNTSMACFSYIRSQILTDKLADLFIKLIHKMHSSAEADIKNKIVADVKRIDGKFDILYLLADTAIVHPDGIIQDKIYPKVSQETLKELVNELKHKGKWYQTQVNTKIRSPYSHAHRKVLLALLDTFTFQANGQDEKMLVDAVTFIKQHQDLSDHYYPNADLVPIENLIPTTWRSMVIEPCSVATSTLEKTRPYKINRLNYEVAILSVLRDQLRCKAVWIEGAYRYRNPDEDLPNDWEARREYYYQLLGLPINAADFVKTLKESLHQNLLEFDKTLHCNTKVKILEKNGGHVKITPSGAQAKPTHIDALHREINRRWSTINLIDILKETDLLVGFNQHFHSVASKESLDKNQLRKRLLLCLYSIGTNTGLKRVSAANDDATYSDLRYVKRRYINETNVRTAIADVVNAILAIREPRIWGEATTGCACDSTQVSSWDQNLMSEWHPRYKDRGVMIYWHVDKNSAVIYSQLKICLSSEVGAMIAGVLKHDTNMNMDKTYVDTPGQSTMGYAFSYGLKFDLLARIKGIHKQKLYYPTTKHKANYPNLEPILSTPINWSLIEENYDEYVKHVAALKTGTAEPDVLIKKFSKDNYHHTSTPTVYSH